MRPPVARHFAWALALIGCAPFQSDPWTAISAKPTVRLINHTSESCDGDVRVKRGDTRALGSVAPEDSTTYPLPFADEEVMVVFCGVATTVSVNGPHLWRIEAYNVGTTSEVVRRRATP